MLGLPSIAIEYFGAAALLLVFGYLIRFREWTFLLAGYDETSPVPSDVAASVAVGCVYSHSETAAANATGPGATFAVGCVYCHSEVAADRVAVPAPETVAVGWDSCHSETGAARRTASINSKSAASASGGVYAVSAKSAASASGGVYSGIGLGYDMRDSTIR